jgi:hypothetical protein
MRQHVHDGDAVWSGNWIWLNLRRFAAVHQAAIMGNPMLKPLDPFRFVLIAVAGWMTGHRLPSRGEPRPARAVGRTSPPFKR